MILTVQDAVGINTSVVIAPAFVPAEPTTNWLFAVAVAKYPNITDPVKFPENVVEPNAEFLEPVELSFIALSPTAVLLLPVVLATKDPCPKLELLLPAVLLSNDDSPTLTFAKPVVLENKDLLPIAVLNDTVLFFNDSDPTDVL